jgi:outer membrane lipoprotein SlyB
MKKNYKLWLSIAIIAMVALSMTALSLTGCDNGNGDPPCSTHTWSGWTTKTEATCTTSKVEKRTCSLCDHEETQNVGEPLGHQVPGLVKETCQTPGNTGSGACTRAGCGQVFTGEIIPINVNAHDWEWTLNAIDATCIEPSKDTAVCKNAPCTATNERINVSDPKPATGHDWKWAVRQPATLTEEGKEEEICDNCGEKNGERNIPRITSFSTLPEATAYLVGKTGSASEPIVLPLSIDLGNLAVTGSGWLDLLNAIHNWSGTHIALDLSACTMSGTSFNPGPSVSTGKNKIVSIILPATATSIDSSGTFSSDSAFFHFTNIQTFGGAGLITIGNGAFWQRTSLTNISLPSGLKTIGENAFRGCTGINSISLPNSVETIGNGAFMDCSNLTQITITSSSQLKSIGDNAFRGTKLVHVDLPVGFLTIGTNAFAQVTTLLSINLPSSLTTIGMAAFSGCTGLLEVVLPVSLTTIGEQAFAMCSGLSVVTSLNPIPPTLGGSGVFFMTPSNLRIFVPAGSVTTYQGATHWSAHSDKIGGL